MKINHSVNFCLLLALAAGLTSSSLWAIEDGLGTNVVKNIRIQPAGVIDLAGTAITNWNQVGSTADVSVLQGATNALNTAVTNVSYQVTNDLYNATNTLNTAASALQTGKVDRAGDTMTGTLNLNTNLNVGGKAVVTNNLTVFGNTVLSNSSALNVYGYASLRNSVQVGPPTAVADEGVSLEVRGTANFRSPYNNNLIQIANGNSSVSMNLNTYNTDSGMKVPMYLDGHPLIINSKDYNAIVPGPHGLPFVMIGADRIPEVTLHIFGSTTIETNLMVKGVFTNNIVVVTNAIILRDLASVTNWNQVGSTADVAALQFATNALNLNKLDRVGGTASNLTAAGTFVQAVGTSTQVITSAGSAITVTSAPFIPVKGDVNQYSASLGSGTTAGQVIILQGQSDTETFTLTNNPGLVELDNKVPFTFANGNTMQLIWNNGKWSELNRVAHIP